MSTTRKPRRAARKVSHTLDAAGRMRAHERRNRYVRAASITDTIRHDPRFAGQVVGSVRDAMRATVSRTVLRRMRRAGKISGPLPRPFRYVHEDDLTGEQREEIGAVLHDSLANQWSGEVGYDSDVEVAYHAGYLLTASWMLFGGTEAYELGEVFDRHGIAVHHDWWLTDGWRDYHDKWGVRCPECNGFSYAKPGDSALSNESDATWPTRCDGCHHPLPAQHRTNVFGADTTWWATCCCGWDPDAFKRESGAKGAATKHRNRAATEQQQAGQLTNA